VQNRIWTAHVGQHVGERITLSGWLHNLRKLSNINFLILRDRTGMAQVVIEDPQLLTSLESCYNESVITLEGEVVAEPAAPGGFEIHRPTIRLLSRVSEPPPVELFRPKLKSQLPTLLDHAPVSLRHPRQKALWSLADASLTGFRRTLKTAGFTEIQTPKIVASATESGANVFALDYFGTPAYLAQSPQFYKQMMVGVFERVFEVGPVFRAEPHATSRHLTEYVSLDMEMGFIDSHHDVMAMLTGVIRGMIESAQVEAATSLALLKINLPAVPEEIPVIHFAEALELIYRETGEDARHEPDLAPAHERWLGEWAVREYGSDFVFVEGYPMVKRPFYTHPDAARPAYSNSFDLLFRGVELVTGGQRLHQYADYLAALEKRGMPVEPFSGYLEAFKYGMPPHGGFAIGLERWVSRLAELSNVREAALFPRDLTRLTP
jgi:nondiscriminating aspartyl-tRNA synthetase